MIDGYDGSFSSLYIDYIDSMFIVEIECFKNSIR